MNVRVATNEGSPADHLDGMASSERSGLVDVNSALVREEVLVHIEGNLNGSVGLDLSLDGSNGGADGVGRGSVVVLHCARARGAGGGRRREEAVSGDTAARGVGVAIIGNDSSVLHVDPRADGVTTVASHVAVSIVARDEVLGGQGHVDGERALDGETVRKSLSGSEGPA